MAEAVLFSLATAILKSLATEMVKPGGAFASQKIQLLCCAGGELQSLEGTIETIKDVLLDAEKRQWHEVTVKNWLKRLKDVLYEVQDLLDDISTENLRRRVMAGNEMVKEVRIFFSKSNQLAWTYKVANKAQELKKKLDGIASDRKFDFVTRLSDETIAIGRGKKTEFFAPDREIIGREEDKEEIIKLLFDSSSSQGVSVVSIVGKGGLGKTALARLVFKDGEIKKHFGLKMWVCVSDVFDADWIIKEILKSAKYDCEGHDQEMQLLQDLDNKPIDQLQSLLDEILGRKKYLLVLDDLWNEDGLRWSKLGDWLKGGVWGSKILITTRSLSVAQVTDANSTIYNLKGLSRNDSWDLFSKVAFRDGQDSVDERLKEMGRDIVKKCAWVPLAIRTIGNLLYNKKEDEWLRYKVLELPEIPEIDAVDEGIVQNLKFSYDHLPSCLKHCFAYCSLFPKDYIYPKEMMIRLWVAQGFIESFSGEEDNLEGVADNYLSNLLCGSFLDAEIVGDDGEVLTFKMHDLMHNLAQKVAGDECKIVRNGGRIDGGIRHASFTSEILSQRVSLFEKSKLRTFLYLEGDGLGKESSALECHEVFPKFRHCRVLGLGKINIPLPHSSFGNLKNLRFLDISENQSIVCLPDSITDLLNLQTLKLSSCKKLSILPRDLKKLVNLRFFDVSENQSIESLPDSITDLLNLETLKLSGCEKLATLPRDLRKLINLKHLLIDRCDSLSHMPCGFNHLSSLQTLSQFILEKMDHEVPGGVGRLDELGALNRLAGSITLQKLEFLQPAPNKRHLREKQRLRSLELKWSWGHQDNKSESDELVVWKNLEPSPNLAHLTISSCMGRSPPRWLSSITSLVELKLDECGGWKYMPPLSELPSLRTLTLLELDELEFIQEVSDPEHSTTTQRFFPSLERLFLLDCRNLKGWWGGRQMVGEDQDHRWYNSQLSFPKLSSVRIVGCPLNSVPLFPCIENLSLDGASAKLLEQQVMASPNCPSETAVVSTFIPLSKLDNLYVGGVDLENSMLETLLQFLSNLESMGLYRCLKLRSLSRGMKYLSSLQHLDICACEELDLSSHDDEHGTQWRSLTKLRGLRIGELPKLVALPEGIQHITTLQSLEIEGCENLTSLPEWIGNFSSLQELQITNCTRLKHLPNEMRHLNSLKKLRIAGCPAMVERC